MTSLTSGLGQPRGSVTAAGLPIQIVNADGYDWGNLLVQLVIAVATIGTLVWGIWTGRDEARRASRDRRERLEFEERIQAAQISAWERQWTGLRDGRPLPQDESDYRNLGGKVVEQRAIYVLNSSNAAIYDVTVRYFDVSLVRDADSGEESDLRGSWFHSILPPESNPRSQEVMRAPNCGALSDDVVLEVEFRDGAGRYWVRLSNGDLVRRRDLEALTVEQRRDRRLAEAERDPSSTS